MSSVSFPGKALLHASFGIGVVLILIANMIWPSPLFDESARIGEVVTGLAVLLMLWSIATLGWSVFSGRVPDKIVAHGIYRYIRHPFFLAMILGFLGLALISNNLLALLSAVLIILPVQVIRAYKEDAEMQAHFGHYWDVYKQRTRYMLPFIW